MRRTQPDPSSTQGAQSNYKNQACSELDECEPAGHGIGRSRGGLSTKIHHAVDGKGRPLSVVVTGGQRNDGAVLQAVIDDIRVPQSARRPGRPRTRPDAVMADRGVPESGKPGVSPGPGNRRSDSGEGRSRQRPQA